MFHQTCPAPSHKRDPGEYLGSSWFFCPYMIRQADKIAGHDGIGGGESDERGDYFIAIFTDLFD
jgi:hypothetical protein